VVKLKFILPYSIAVGQVPGSFWEHLKHVLCVTNSGRCFDDLDMFKDFFFTDDTEKTSPRFLLKLDSIVPFFGKWFEVTFEISVREQNIFCLLVFCYSN